MSQIQKNTLKFLKELAANNNKPWFDAHRNDYEQARGEFIQFTENLIAGISVFDPQFKTLDARKCVFRIYRDVRFSKDKRPYKVNFGANLGIGKQGTPAGYYLQIQPGNQSFAAAGAYMPEPASLAAIRQEIDYNLKDFEKLLKSAAFKKDFDGLDEIEVLKTTPKGYQPDNPAIGYLRHKSFVVSKTFTDKEVLDPGFLKTVTTILKHGQPLVAFLNKAAK